MSIPLKLKKPLTPLVVRALSTMQVVLGSSTSFVLIGATARDIIFEYIHGLRAQIATKDLDVAIFLSSWDQFAAVRSLLLANNVFTTETTNPWAHRIFFEKILPIDLLPFGKLENSSGKITWPPTDREEMSTVGLRDVFNSSCQVEIMSGCSIPVATAAGQFILKLIAWNDQPYRKHDAQDIAFILNHYLDIGNLDRLYDQHSDLITVDFDIQIVGASLLGRDLKSFISDETRSRMISIIKQQLNDNGNLIGWMSLGVGGSNDRYELYLAMLKAVLKNL